MQITLDSIRQFLKTFQPQPCDDDNLIPAGVLVLLFEQNAELHVVLTQRTDEVERHKGQVSFPGGIMEEGDATILDTALRETEEEIGLSRTSIEVLGTLSDYPTSSGFRITPVVASLSSPHSFALNTSEVSEIFEVPLSFFLNIHNERVERYEYAGTMTEFYFYQFRQYKIWGVTAGILRLFLKDVLIWLEGKKTL
jgi:8-oxo-dGTP pyrophosphatase MutT (NUDIX family)